MNLNNNHKSINMFSNNNDSDYGSGSASSSSSWMSQQDIRCSGRLSCNQKQSMERPCQKSSSYTDLIKTRCTLDDVMREFQMNGSDSPYNPDEDRIWGDTKLPFSGMGPPSAYLRQRSWPAPERSPATAAVTAAASRRFSVPPNFTTSTPIFDESPAFAPPAPVPSPVQAPSRESSPLPWLTDEQSRVLNSLPQGLLTTLVKQLKIEKRVKVKTNQECRFCKNNGERETYYRSHVLKDASGRVTCPVLRAFVCMRCGARGDRAHTIKYCPFSTDEERLKSSAMMRSVRLASGRRRGAQVAPPTSTDNYVMFGEPPRDISANYDQARTSGDAYVNSDQQRSAGDAFINYDQQNVAGNAYMNFDQQRAIGNAFIKNDEPRAIGDVYANYDAPRGTGDVNANYDAPRATGDVYANYDVPRATGDVYANYVAPRATGDLYANYGTPRAIFSNPQRAAGDIFSTLSNTEVPLDPQWVALEQKLML